MLLLDAIEKAENDEHVKSLASDGYFLCSGFASLKSGSINEWILHYYSPKNRKVVDCFVGQADNAVTVGEETPAVKEMHKIDKSSIKITVDKALDTVKKAFRGKASSILIVLHKKQTLVWTINMITLDMTVNSFDVDAASGKILDRKTVSLIKKFDIDSKYETKS